MTDEQFEERLMEPSDNREAFRRCYSEACRARRVEQEQASTIVHLREALAQQKEMHKRAVDAAAELLAAVNGVLGYVHMHSADMGGNHRYTLMRGHGPAVARLQHLAAQQTEKKP